MERHFPSVAERGARSPRRVEEVRWAVPTAKLERIAGTAMEAPLTPLRAIEEDPNAAIARFAKSAGLRLRQEIERERRRETEEDRQADERFE